MRSLFFFLFLGFFACAEENTSEENDHNTSPATDSLVRQPQNPPADAVEWREYTNDKYQFQTRWPEHWPIEASPPSATLPVINLYRPSRDSSTELPLNIHTPAGMTHLSIYPKGWGTALPAGRHETIAEYVKGTPVAFSIDRRASYVFLLEDGQAWGYLLRPARTPDGWNKKGYIFAQIAVDSFSSQCFDRLSGKLIPRYNCDPVRGDRLVRKGNIRLKDQRVILTALAEWAFLPSEERRQPLSDLIRVEQPLPDTEIRSPLTIKGEARGQWFFEGDFPVSLQDQDYNTLVSGIARAQGKWMTTDFVPFELTLHFEGIPDDKRGYLVFHKSNASGKPSMDRNYRIPVRFPDQ